MADVDRGLYESLDFRAALHPSESQQYLLTRVLAYALNVQDGLEFSPSGLSDPDAPALLKMGAQGRPELIIEVGNTNPRKLHKATKSAEAVKIYTYKDPELLLKELSGSDIHKSDQVQIFSLNPRFLDHVGLALEKDNRWSLMHTQGSLILTLADGQVEQTELRQHRIEVV